MRLAILFICHRASVFGDELALLETARPWHEREADEVVNDEADITDSADIDMMGFDGEIHATTEQTIEQVDSSFALVMMENHNA